MKRMIDFIGGIIISIVFLPVFLIICFIQVIDIGFPMMKKKQYVNIKGDSCHFHRFKTTSYVMEEGVFVRKQTRFGRFLKRSGLENLPQLLTVITGEMSLVGPSPQVVKLLSRTKKYRYPIKPGIMGWSQLYRQPNMSVQQLAELDQYYLTNQSIWLDLKIMKKSLSFMLRRKFIG